MAGDPRGHQQKRRHERTLSAPPAHPPLNTYPVPLWRNPGQLFLVLINVDIDYMALLVASLVSFIVFYTFKQSRR
jgi:hypothetical protein